MTYGIGPGVRLNKIAPEALGAELERIEEVNGSLTAASVFEAARPKDAPLHPEFVWDGKAAIEELGHMRARTLIRGVVVLAEPMNQEPTRVWVHVPPESGKGAGEYDRVNVVARVEDRYQRAFSELNSKFESAASALRELKQAAGSSPNPDRLRQFTIAEEAFTTVREAIALLRQ